MKFEEYLQSNKEHLNHETDSDRMWNKINKDLSEKSPSTSNFGWIVLGFIVLLIIGFGLYSISTNKAKIDTTETELFVLKENMNNLIAENKTSSRIRAVSMSNQAAIIDNDIINVLVDRLKNDESSNVQLAAIRALESHIQNENVRIAMIETLATTQDNYLQIKIIDLLTQHKEKRLLPILDSITTKYNENSIVIDPAKRAGKILKEI